MFNKLLNIGVNYQTTRLNLLRQKSINIFSLAFIGVMLISIIFRLIGGEYFVAIVTVFSLLLMLLTFYFSHKNKFGYSILVSCLVPFSLIIIVALGNKLSCVNLIGPLILVIIVFLIIIRKESHRWMFLLVSLTSLVWIGLRYENTVLFTGSLTIQVFGICIGFIYFVRYLELQDDELNTALQNELILNKKLSIRNDDLQTFSHIMTHDFKSPIRNIKGFTHLIKKKAVDLDEKLMEYFTYIEKSSTNMETLINELLKFQKIEQESIELQEVNLNSILERIKEIHCTNITDRKNKMVYDDMPRINGDESLIKTLFTNLISNSFKYQPLDQANHIPTVTLSSTISDDHLTIIIRDNGIGISKEFAENIFEPFTRLHNSQEYSGTGLGLSICKKVMQKHNGNIQIIDFNSTGTTFHLTFPN